MILQFTLSMPNVGSWNGKWSGADNLYARIVNVGSSKKTCDYYNKIISNSPYHYNFGDGWSASVDVKEISGKESPKVRKKSRGFCGYDWMIDEIRMYGEIRPLSKRIA